MNPYRVAVVGCAGRMGRMNLAAIQAAEGCVIVGGSDQQGSPAIGTDIGLLIGQAPLGVLVGEDPVEERKSVVQGQSVTDRLGSGGGLNNKKKKEINKSKDA